MNYLLNDLNGVVFKGAEYFQMYAMLGNVTSSLMV